MLNFVLAFIVITNSQYQHRQAPGNGKEILGLNPFFVGGLCVRSSVFCLPVDIRRAPADSYEYLLNPPDSPLGSKWRRRWFSPMPFSAFKFF
jgi:hypothetical protein